MLKLIADGVIPSFSDYIYSGVLIIPVMLLAYTNLLLLLPRWKSKKRFLAYLAEAIAAVLLFTLLTYTIFDRILDIIIPSFLFVPILTYLDIILLGVITIIVSALLFFTKSWFYTEQERAQMAILRQQKSDAELRLLKSQLNPHFLFNSLNSIYALVLRKSDSAADTLIQLSDIIRYMVYETSATKIALSREMEVLQAYIELQRMRLNEGIEVTYLIKGVADDKQIAPMLLFPFVENAFKHGTKGTLQNGYVRINMNIANESISFEVLNSKGTMPYRQETSGIGLSNVKQQLLLIYPNRHTLTVSETDKTFSVNLTIQL